MKTYDLPGVFYEDMITLQAQLIKETDPSKGFDTLYRNWLHNVKSDWREPVEDMIINLVPYVWLRYSAGHECVEEKKNGKYGRYITDVDIDIETYTTCFFKDLFKKNADKVEFVSQELGKKSSSSDYYICIDPVNGTENMMNWAFDEAEDFNTSIALIDHGEVVVSFIINHSRALVTARGAKTLLITRESMRLTGTAPVYHPQVCNTIATNNIKKLKDSTPSSNIRMTGCPTCDILRCIFGRTKRAELYRISEWEFRACQLIAEEYGVEMTVSPRNQNKYNVSVRW